MMAAFQFLGQGCPLQLPADANGNLQNYVSANFKINTDTNHTVLGTKVFDFKWTYRITGTGENNGVAVDVTIQEGFYSAALTYTLRE